MRQRKTRAIVLIWAVVLSLAFLGAAFFADDDPSTDDPSGFGALAAVVGGVLTVVYLAITKPKPSSIPRPQPRPVRECPSCRAHMDCGARTCPACGSDSEPWVRHEGVWWFQSQSGAWQWLDENDGLWRWYEEGTPSTPLPASTTTSAMIDPEAAGPPAPSGEPDT